MYTRYDIDKINKELGYDKYAVLSFADFKININSITSSFRTAVYKINYKQHQKNSRRMNHSIRTLKLNNIKLLYLDSYIFSNKNQDDMKLFVNNNQHIEALVCIYDSKYINDKKHYVSLDNIYFQNLKHLYITRDAFGDDDHINYDNLITKYSNTIKYLYLDDISIQMTNVIQKCSELIVLNLNMPKFTPEIILNILCLLQNATCRDIIINKIYKKYVCGKTKKFITMMIEMINKNEFIKKFIIKETNFDINFSGNLLRKIGNTKLLLAQFGKTKIYPNEKFIIDNFFDVKFLFNFKYHI